MHHVRASWHPMYNNIMDIFNTPSPFCHHPMDPCTDVKLQLSLLDGFCCAEEVRILKLLETNKSRYGFSMMFLC